MKALTVKLARTEQFRFLISGGINTVATYLLYVLLLPVMGYALAYTVTYVLGMVLSYFLNRLFVFRKPARVDHFVTFPAAYLVPYLTGLVLLRLLIGSAGMDARLAPIVAMMVTVPLSFLLLRAVLRGPSKKQDP